MNGGSERDAAGVGGAHSWRELHTNIARRHQQLSPPTISASSPPHPSKKSPKPPPLPANDYKIIVRIRGGLDCSKIHSCVLRQIILKAAGLPINEHTAQDQLRVNEISNTILVSTPNMDRADSYNTIRTLNFNGTTYEVATHVADPSDTCRGVILLPIDSPEQAILPTLISYNPDLTVGSARRLGNTESILITFQGKRVPYYINYEGCALRCIPYRQKIEACTRCRKVGHRQDVCPFSTDTRCPNCGTLDPSMDHDCKPVCIVCNGAHPTGSQLCKQRYKPQQTPSKARSQQAPSFPAIDPAQARARSSSKTPGPHSTSQGEAWPALPPPPPPPSKQATPPPQVSWARVASTCSSPSQPSNLETSLLRENATLKEEIRQLKLSLQSTQPPSPSQPYSLPSSQPLTPSLPSPTPTSNDPPSPMDVAPESQPPTTPSPPNKRKTPDTPRTEDRLDDTLLGFNDRITTLESKAHQLQQDFMAFQQSCTAQFVALNDKLDRFLEYVMAQLATLTQAITPPPTNSPPALPSDGE
ncbi:hypothetical protein HPB49_002013 [Dermacentor silvarum]|uniref:Uncharacterized protein n=1 Tax=Dermacentor silvarum TaxID=543639 RepID=A0ACB8C6Y8_DERSI|nr:hypothetical protein HPB49_002013 [Dermacentor silvarum]